MKRQLLFLISTFCLILYSCDDSENDSAPGTITEVCKDFIRVATGKGSLKILELQLEGKKRMKTRDFLNGAKIPDRMEG